MKKCCACCGSKMKYFCSIILLLVGGIFIALPFVTRDYIDKIIKTKIDKNVKISPSSQIYDEWLKPTLPIYLQFYMFSIVNPLEVMRGDVPFVVQKGPYSYRESRLKYNISWGYDKVNYNQRTRYKFDPNTSCPTCDPHIDMVRSLNIPYNTLVQKIPPFLRHHKLFDELVSMFMSYFKEGLFIKKSVHEVIWGYNEPLFDDYDKFRKELEKTFGKKLVDNWLPKLPPIFALQQNPNVDGYTTVNTGNSDVNLVGQYEQWKGNEGHLHIWKSATANMINGTDGSLYKPALSKHDILYIFIIQLCRSLNVIYLDKQTIKGINGYRFRPPKYLFQSGNINPNNKGFCNPNCLPSGLLSINGCVPFNAPIIVSSPHFLHGNKSLRQEVHGLKPVEEKHDTFLTLEPHTGILLRASKRMQFNIHVVPLAGFKDLENVKAVNIPIMWINEHVEIDSANAEKLKKDVLRNIEIVKWVGYGLIILGGIMVLIAFILVLRLCCASNDGKQMKLIAENGGGDLDDESGYPNSTMINAST